MLFFQSPAFDLRLAQVVIIILTIIAFGALSYPLYLKRSASGEGLKPNEGTECEKRLIKDFDKIHTLQVHAKISQALTICY